MTSSRSSRPVMSISGMEASGDSELTDAERVEIFDAHGDVLGVGVLHRRNLLTDERSRLHLSLDWTNNASVSAA